MENSGNTWSLLKIKPFILYLDLLCVRNSTGCLFMEIPGSLFRPVVKPRLKRKTVLLNMIYKNTVTPCRNLNVKADVGRIPYSPRKRTPDTIFDSRAASFKAKCMPILNISYISSWSQNFYPEFLSKQDLSIEFDFCFIYTFKTVLYMNSAL